MTGMRNGQIARHELSTLPPDLHYTCQPKAKFYKDIITEWVCNVIGPYVATSPPHVVPLLLLDSFKVHMQADVINAIQCLGIQAEFIPPGCTGLLQLVDVGFNKAFKAKLRTEYNWLWSQDLKKPIPASTHANVTRWIITLEQNISTETIKNAWRKTGLLYFDVSPLTSSRHSSTMRQCMLRKMKMKIMAMPLSTRPSMMVMMWGKRLMEKRVGFKRGV